MTDTNARALVVLAPGTEEMEAVIAIDVLRRGGVEVVVAGLDGKEPVSCSRDVVIVPEVALADVPATGDGGRFQAIVLPGGGPGSEALAASDAVGRWLRQVAGDGGAVAAICAAPGALVAHGIGAGRPMTSHPAVRDRVAAFADYREDPVVATGLGGDGGDALLLTSRGPGTAFLFSLRLLAHLQGLEVADQVAGPMMFPAGS